MWQEYESIGNTLSKLFKVVINEHILEINGVVSQDGWEPDWPIVIKFESMSIGFHTKNDYLWSIDSFENIEFCYEKNDLPLDLKYKHLRNHMNINRILNRRFAGLFKVKNHSGIEEQAFLLQVGRYFFKIFDAGDELGIEILTSVDINFWEKIV